MNIIFLANMAEERSKKIFTEFMTKAAIQTVIDEFPEQNFDQETIQRMRKEAESTVKELTETLHKIKTEERRGEDAVSHLSAERIEKMKKALDMKTFEIRITEAEKKAEIRRNGNVMYPSISLDTVANINQATNLQIASIVVEALIVVLDLVGVNIPDDAETIRRVIDVVVNQLGKSNNLQNDVEQIREDRGDYLAMARDIFTLVIDTFYDGIFWSITKALLYQMSWTDWIISAGRISAFLATLVGTGGLAQLSSLVTELVNAAFFLQKLVNLGNLQKMKLAITAS